MIDRTDRSGVVEPIRSFDRSDLSIGRISRSSHSSDRPQLPALRRERRRTEGRKDCWNETLNIKNELRRFPWCYYTKAFFYPAWLVPEKKAKHKMEPFDGVLEMKHNTSKFNFQFTYPIGAKFKKSIVNVEVIVAVTLRIDQTTFDRSDRSVGRIGRMNRIVRSIGRISRSVGRSSDRSDRSACSIGSILRSIG